MRNAVSALPGARSSGLVELAEGGRRGMVALRGEIGSEPIARALRDTFGLSVPETRRMVSGERAAVAWMAPDELLILVDPAVVTEMLAALEAELQGAFATLVDVSDARAIFTIRGTQARDVLAKTCPVDFADFPVGTIRRTRAAQVAAAVWRDAEDEFTLVCFRSVAQYMWDLLTTLARPGGEVGLYR
jgi:sarcosine oxidase, subunit gamma